MPAPAPPAAPPGAPPNVTLPARLVEMLPGVPRQTLATVICGEIATRFDCPSSYLRVLHALICHAGWHGNRVWASQRRLASVAGIVKSVCVKTVQRAIQYFVQTLGLRVVSDAGERLRGPGEHVFLTAGNKKKGDGPVNHYDLSALRAFVPQELRTFVARDMPNPQGPPCFPDPFADPLPVSPSSLSKSTRHPCNVDEYEKENGKPEKARSEAPRRLKFEKTKLSPVRERSTATAIDTDAPGFRALAKAGVSAGMRRVIIAARGDTWAGEAALYTRLQQARGEIQTTPAQYLVAVFQNWQAERAAGRPIAWPDWLQARLERERAAARRVVRTAESEAVPIPPSIKQPIPNRVVPSPPPLPLPPPDPLAGRTDDERRILTEAARRELRKSLPGAPAALIEHLLPARLAAMVAG